MFATETRKLSLKTLLPSHEARTAALVPCSLRGLQHMLSRSDLEGVCAVDTGGI